VDRTRTTAAIAPETIAIQDVDEEGRVAATL